MQFQWLLHQNLILIFNHFNQYEETPAYKIALF